MVIGTENETSHATDTADTTAHAHETEDIELGRRMKSARALRLPFANANTARGRHPLLDHRHPNAAVAVARSHDHGRHTSATRSLCLTKKSLSAASITRIKRPPSMVAHRSTRRNPTSSLLARSRSTPTVSRAPRSLSNTTSPPRRVNRLPRSPGASLCSRATT
jgi:hypothetical protein